MKNEETFSPNNKNENKAIGNNENATILKNQRKANKEGLTLGIVTTSIIAIIILVAGGIYGNSLIKSEKEKQVTLLESQRHLFSDQLTERDSAINEWVLTFDQIEKDLNLVKEQEHIITVQSSDPEFTKERKQQILKDIEYINTLLDQNKKKIASLNAQLKKSGGTLKSLQDKIAMLEESMIVRENEISDLKLALLNKNFEIEQLNTRMTDLQFTILQKDVRINQQTDGMNQAFLASGTYKDLKEKGLVSKEGGFLGLGRQESLVEDFADTSFAQIKITETLTIPVNSKAVKLITEHPSSSYEMIHDNENKIAYIEIIDPNQFWKISKYAVVEIKN
jgi:hypothetical protein